MLFACIRRYLELYQAVFAADASSTKAFLDTIVDTYPTE